MIKKIWQWLWVIPITMVSLLYYLLLIIAFGDKKAGIIVDYLCEGFGEAKYPDEY